MADLTQLVISLALGISAFTGFCFLRPRWAGLYAARKQHTDAASVLPELPQTFLGWMPVLYRITHQEVLASAGLDAYVFLAFFRLAIKLLVITLLLVLFVRTPVHYSIYNELPQPPPPNNTSTTMSRRSDGGLSGASSSFVAVSNSTEKPSGDGQAPIQFYWMHLVLTYVFTSIILYMFVSETKKIIKVRQEYLGTQSTVTDRTIRLSGIPKELRSEENIKEFTEKLEIGKVQSVTLCRDWSELDDLMQERDSTLRKLEEAWTVHLGHRRVERSRETLPVAQPPPPAPYAEQDSDQETSGLLGDDSGERSHVTPYVRDRPTTKIRFGTFKLQSKVVDAIDYYEERLRKLDEKVKETREKEFEPTAIAFVTLDSIAACQMAIQAVLDPSPMRLQTQLAPAPSDVVWTNTYMSRSSRMTRAWTVTLVVTLMSILWVSIVPWLGILVQLESLRKVAPSFVAFLDEHKILRSLVHTGLPTAFVSLLNVSVPYIYDWLSNLQGMISQSDVEMSVISKNFFFTFFNLFLVLTILGTSIESWPVLNKQSFDGLANRLASSLESYGELYANLIILQGLGLFPFKLLEFGSIALYPISLMGAKTPRDYAELVQPPMFKYGFYLPQTLLIFILCIVYSLLDTGLFILFFGLLYFLIGYFTYKYQLLYAMDHLQHSTGKAWPIICYRSFLGVGVFQVAMAGWMALRTKEPLPSVLILPLFLLTLWFTRVFARTYEPLLQFIALRSIRREDDQQVNLAGESMADGDLGGPSVWNDEIANESTVDEEREKGMKFVNPNLISPLGGVWLSEEVNKRRADEAGQIGDNDGGDSV
ncbi:MAG: hypothetical protein M1833_006388 [Piccolia ochrophora]|nr:MAG: hypothetical protein M1833_006388 [Piccolia ochrophora]